MEELMSNYLAALAGCMCTEVNEIGSTCFCGITVGDEFISMSGFGDCEEDSGEAWVRITSVYPVGADENNPASNCNVALGLDIEMGVLRAFEIPEGGEAPDADSLLQASDSQIKDMMAMYRAILCCQHFPEVELGTWLPLGPDSGLIGGVWTLSVGLY